MVVLGPSISNYVATDAVGMLLGYSVSASTPTAVVPIVLSIRIHGIPRCRLGWSTASGYMIRLLCVVSVVITALGIARYVLYVDYCTGMSTTGGVVG
jgi:hypothetical protein